MNTYKRASFFSFLISHGDTMFLFLLLYFLKQFLFARELLHTTKRQEDTCDNLRSVIGDSILGCEIEMVGPKITACSQTPPSFLPSAITEYVFQRKTPSTNPNGLLTSKNVSIKMDNLLSPAHTLVQISCQDHKGLLYDIMRTLKDYNIQVEYLSCHYRRLSKGV